MGLAEAVTPKFGMRINCYYKYLLYLAGVILVLSFFVEVKSFDVSLLRTAAFGTIVISVGIWICDDVIGKLNNFIYMRHMQSRKNDVLYYQYMWATYSVFILMQILAWFLMLNIIL